MTDHGLVSVIIPAFNAGDFIQETIASVLNQTYSNIEIIVVDDGSSDLTPLLVDELSASTQVPIRLIQQPNRGVSAARNQGASAARGKYFSFLDADDVWLPDKIRRQLEVLNRRSRSIGVLCAYEIFEHSTSRIIDAVLVRDTEHLFRNWLTLQGPGPLLPSTLLMTRETWGESSGFNEQLSTSADLDFGMRLLKQGELTAVEEVLVRYRLSDGQMHRDPKALERDYQIILEAEYLAGNSSLRIKTMGNLSLHLAYKKWRATPSVKNTLSLVGNCARYPRQASKRLLRCASRKLSLVDRDEPL